MSRRVSWPATTTSSELRAERMGELLAATFLEMAAICFPVLDKYGSKPIRRSSHSKAGNK